MSFERTLAQVYGKIIGWLQVLIKMVPNTIRFWTVAACTNFSQVRSEAIKAIKKSFESHEIVIQK